MTNTARERQVMVQAALEFVPPLLRKSLLAEQTFIEQHGLQTEALIVFGSSGVSVQRSKLFNSIRVVLDGNASAEWTDAENRVWTLTAESRAGVLQNLELSSEQLKVDLPEFFILSGDATTRLRSLEESALDMNLPLRAREKWRHILQERALEDDEVASYHSDMRDTPTYVEGKIRTEITAGETSVSSLVPNSRRYFERLVGAYDGSISIQDYAANVGRRVIEQLIAWRPYEGLLYSLFLSSHSALIVEIDAARLNRVDTTKALGFLERHGDILSRLGAIELGLRMLPDWPEVEPLLLRLIQIIRDDDVGSGANAFKLFSALFVLVDGQLAATHLLADTPPFYRRLASLAHAALIHRQFVQGDVDCQSFVEWALNNGGESFYIQSLADMRIDPRWCPDLAAASQVQQDFFGRIMIAGHSSETCLGKGELRDTILGDGEQSLATLCELPRPYFPGPLEGGDSIQNALPENIASIIETQLNSDTVSVASFIALVNFAKVYRVTSAYAELAANTLRRGNYSLGNIEGPSQLAGALNGIAMVAATSRCPALSNELRIVVRRYRQDSQYGLSADDAFRISLVASAAHFDRTEWRVFLGDWLTELAFGELGANEGEVLFSRLSVLLHSVPDLWLTCAKADAALQAWCCR